MDPVAGAKNFDIQYMDIQGHSQSPYDRIGSGYGRLFDTKSEKRHAVDSYRKFPVFGSSAVSHCGIEYVGDLALITALAVSQ